MGRPNQSPVLITHFSHTHPLRLTAAVDANCAACALPASPPSYSCPPCGFLLHLSCADLPTLLVHPCDPAHGLGLLPRPPYPDGAYTCDACKLQGWGFVYHCAACGLDLHTRCAVAPLTVGHPAHPQHALALTFEAPYGEGKGFSCDMCGRGGAAREWMYRCAACEFDSHLACAGAATALAYGGGDRGAAAVGASGGGGRGGLVESVAQGIAVGFVQGIIGGGGGGGGGGEMVVGEGMVL
ncbi:hypothetical protein HPP92_008445 [Vanilla planifolia]|uniref:DC1 domain-containing protein n=1 Tax=Vanilla planifolia TaxID=51239 RepID=A0A835R823_VANPL|nr:hypothetical protein HPP92_008445 [Vanilla planifolia]